MALDDEAWLKDIAPGFNPSNDRHGNMPHRCIMYVSGSVRERWTKVLMFFWCLYGSIQPTNPKLLGYNGKDIYIMFTTGPSVETKRNILCKKQFVQGDIWDKGARGMIYSTNNNFVWAAINYKIYRNSW